MLDILSIDELFDILDSLTDFQKEVLEEIERKLKETGSDGQESTMQGL